MPDFDRMRYEELASISEMAHGLSDEQWDHDSLCGGWRVRDVISHMTVGYTTSLLSTMGKVARHGFNVSKASGAESIVYGSSHTPAQILAVFDTIHTDHVRKGATRFIPAKESLVDHIVHHQDIRRPLGLPRQVPRERLLAALVVAPDLGGFVGAKKRAAGLRLVATDLEWSHGEGPDIRGAGEAILLAVTGRPVVLGELSGDGVAVLRDRLGA